MKFSHLGFMLARFALALFVLLTAGYCLLAYIPFTYHQIHLGGLLGWLSFFARFHPLTYWLAFVAAALTLPLKKREARLGTTLFLIAYGLAGIRLVFHPLLINLENSIYSLYWCYFSLIPLVWMAAIDWRTQRKQLTWAPAPCNDTRRIFRACWCSALFVWLMSSTITLLRYIVLNHIGSTTKQWLWLLGWSLALHLLVFMAIFLLLNFIAALSGMTARIPEYQVGVFGIAAVVVVTFILRSIVFIPLSFSGWLANVASLAVAFSFVAFFCGSTARLCIAEQSLVEGPLEFFFVPIQSVRKVPPIAQILALLLVSSLGGYILVKIGVTDWEYLFQKLLLLAIWGFVFAFFYLVIPFPRKPGGDSLVVGASSLLCLYMGLAIVHPRFSIVALSVDSSISLDDYANYDIGFRVTHAITSPPVMVAADDSFYSFLQANTNIPRSAVTHPVEIKLAADASPSAGPKPNIFIFVVDSLRRDYLSVYNRDVAFTPAIEGFARESTVFENAFTRYTGTGLSEPSIWSGAMLLHKQYVTPFYPMNSLQKLLESDGYRQFIAKDEVLTIIMSSSASVTELEAGKSTMDLEFCPALMELQDKINETRSIARPIFAYIQPQDIHVSVINRSGRSKPSGEEYPGFDAPYASRVRRLDACFGEFIRYLKGAGLFENSVIILTGDHGDSLGEKGRWGHAYNVVPEVVRIPLLIHVPAEIRPPIIDPTAPAFLIDITPSLYYLLGRKPVAQNLIFGRPLFTMTQSEAGHYMRDAYLIASSYGPVYGLLTADGHSLYVSDAVQFKDFLYQWGDGSPNASNRIVTSEMRLKDQQQIRDYINEISRFYEFNGPR